MSQANRIAIVGIACIYPGARHTDEFWRNIVAKKDCTREVPLERWDPEIFYDPDPSTPDRVYCKRGGYVPSWFAFNAVKHGIPPNTVTGAEPDQFLVLRTVCEALEDAGILQREVQGVRASVILGKGNYMGPGGATLMYRSTVTEQTLDIIRGIVPEITPEQLNQIRHQMRVELAPIHADMAGGLIPNVTTGRTANRLDFMGPNFTIDAACASSLLAIQMASEGLSSGRDDLAIAGGVHLYGHYPFLTVFNSMRALSLGSVIRPFDDACDGTMNGEGLGILILKRVEDAERDRNRIYAVIRAVGSSSDGRARGISAPRLEGEVLAMRRAYESAGVDPRSVGLIEGHGTATSVGDQVETLALREVFGEAAQGRPTCGVGSVKSMIGHTMPAAGAAGTIKAALALYHRVLPPTLNVRQPRHELVDGKSPFYVNTEARPWIHPLDGEPRRAGVSAFGFGGINAHVLLEEYRGTAEAPVASPPATLLREWDCEVVVLEAPSRAALAGKTDRLLSYTSRAAGIALRDIAYTANSAVEAGGSAGTHRVAIVASSLDDLSAKLARVHTRLSQPECPSIKDREGIYYFGESPLTGGKVALLFPGEGSQYLNMLSELCIHFPVVRESFDAVEAVSPQDPGRWPLSAVVYPPPFFSAEEEKAADARLWDMERATEAVLTADGAVVKLLAELGVEADMMVGHSAGEWVALAASGVLEPGELVANMTRLTAAYRSISGNGDIPKMAMLAVGTGSEKVEKIVAELDRHVYIANDNCPHQVVIVLETADAEAVTQALTKKGIFVERLSFDRGYHTPVFTYMCDPLRECFDSMSLRPPRLPLYSCNKAEPYPADRGTILEMVTNTFARPLHFRQTIEAMYADGARIFVEAGPRGNLTAFVDDILRGKPHLAVPVDSFSRPGLLAFQHAIGMLAAAHVPLRFGALYERRKPAMLAWDLAKDLPPDETKEPGTMMVPLLYPRLVPPPEPLPARVIRETVVVEAATSNATPSHADDGHRNGHAANAHAASGQASSSHGSSSRGSYGHSHHEPAYEAYSEPEQVEEAPTLLDAHFALMQQMLNVEQAVMTGLFGGGRPAGQGTRTHATPAMPAALTVQEAAAAPTARPVERRRDPLLRGYTIASQKPGEIVVKCAIDASEHLYLEDHCLYPRIPIPEAKGTGMFSMPLTGSLEVLCESAGLLFPGRIVTGMRDINAPKWLDVEESGPPTEIEVTVRQTANDAARAILRSGGTVLTEATVMFADHFPPAPKAGGFPLKNEKPPKTRGADIYRLRRMFHGPRFQGVADVERVGEDGVAGPLRVLPYSGLMRSDDNPAFHFDFYLLDAAGQFVGYWPAEYFDDGIVAVPVRVGEIQFFRRDLTPGDMAECRARMRSVNHRQLMADYDVIGKDGSVWMRVTGWTDWRFHWGGSYIDFWRFPDRGGISLPLEFPALAGAPVECRRFDPPVALDKTGLWEKLLMRLLLTPQELKTYFALPAAEKTAWATSMGAAKDTANGWIHRTQGRDLYPIQILEGEDGRVKLVSAPGVEAPYLASVHRDNTAVAVACTRPVQIGLVSFESDARDGGLSAAELEVIGRCPDPAAWRVLCRAAKQAAAKFAPQAAGAAAQVAAIDPAAGIILLTHPAGGHSYMTYAIRDGAYAVAIAFQEESS